MKKKQKLKVTCCFTVNKIDHVILARVSPLKTIRLFYHFHLFKLILFFFSQARSFHDVLAAFDINRYYQ